MAEDDCRCAIGTASKLHTVEIRHELTEGLLFRNIGMTTALGMKGTNRRFVVNSARVTGVRACVESSACPIPSFEIKRVVFGVGNCEIYINEILARGQERKSESHRHKKNEQRSESDFFVVHNT